MGGGNPSALSTMKPMRILLLAVLVVVTASAQIPQKLVKSVDSTAVLLTLNPNDVHNVAITSYDTVAETPDNGTVYRYYPLSVAVTNGTTILKPNSFNGRWIRINGSGTGTGGGTNGTPEFINGTNTVTGLHLTNTATITWVNLGVSNAAASVVLNSIGGAQITIDATAEAEIEAVVDLSDLQGAVTDAQVPNSITIDNATLAATASAGDSATAFFTIGTLENARLDNDLEALGNNTGLGLWAITAVGTGSTRTITNGVGILVDVGGGVSGNPSVRHNIEAGSNITLSTNSGALVITASSGATGDNISFNATNTADANFTNSASISWIHNSATTPDDITANIIASSITAAMMANGDHGDFTYAGNVATIDANAVALTTDTTGNYVADVLGTALEITSTHTPGEGSTATLSLPAVIDLGGKTSFEIPNAAAPTVDAFGEIAGDNNLWAASRGAPVFFDGTAAVALVGALVSDAPSNGQVPTWNTGGTITWETPSGSGDITGVGDVASGDAFNGTQGTTLTFNDTGGDHTFLFNTTLDQFELSTNIVGSKFSSTNGFVSLGAAASATLVAVGTSFDTTVTFADPSAARSVVFGDMAGTVILSGHTFTGDVTATLDSDGSTALTIAANSVALTTDTTGNYALGDAEGGNASTVVVIDSTDATSFIAMFDSATGGLAVKTDGGLLYNASTADLTATEFTGGTFEMTGGVGVSGRIHFMENGVQRGLLMTGGDGTPGNFTYGRYSAGGVFQDLPFTISGASGAATFLSSVTAGSLLEGANAVPNATDTLGFFASTAVGSASLTMNTARLLGRTTASSGAIEEITVGAGLSLSAGALTATAGATSWTDIGDASGDTTVALAGFETDWTSTLDASNEAIISITNTDADAANANSFIELLHNDGGDAQVQYMKFVGDADSGATVDYLFSQTAFNVGAGIAINFSGADSVDVITPSANDNDTSAASTAYVQSELTAYASDTVTFTGKTLDAAGTGNVLKSTKYMIFQRPDYGDGAGAVPQTNTFTASGLMHYTFSGNAETNVNWVVYEGVVPADFDTAVAMTAKFNWLSGGTDADDYVFDITYAQQAAGAAYVTGTTIATSPIRITTTPTTAANGDLQSSAVTTLTGWAAALTAGTPIQIRVARLQNTQDDGARDVSLVIAYGSNQ